MTATRDLYTVAEVAERMGTTRSTVYVLIKSKGLPSVLIGGLRRVPVGPYERWLDAQMPPALTPPSNTFPMDALWLAQRKRKQKAATR